MSKNNTLETSVLNAFAAKVAFPTLNAWRVQPIVSYTGLETDAFTVPSYSGYAAQAVTGAQMTVSGNSLVINTRKTFPAVAGAQITIQRFVLEGSADGGSTYPYKYYSDSDLNATVAVGVEPYLEANTGFTAVEE